MGSVCFRWRQPLRDHSDMGQRDRKGPISITKRHFPNMAHLGDITRMDGGAIPPVHVLTFGSPCQNLSQIGNRDGLAGASPACFFKRSALLKK